MSRPVVIEYRVRKVRVNGVTAKTGRLVTKSRNPNWIAWRIMKANPGFQTCLYSTPPPSKSPRVATLTR